MQKVNDLCQQFEITVQRLGNFVCFRFLDTSRYLILYIGGRFHIPQ